MRPAQGAGADDAEAIGMLILAESESSDPEIRRHRQPIEEVSFVPS